MTKQKLNKDIINGLNSADKATQLKAIERIRLEGFSGYLPHLAQVYASSDKTDVRDKVAILFQDLKDTDAVNEVMLLLQGTSNADLRSMLLTACWSSSLDFSPFLIDFVQIAVQYDYMVAFEVLTVIENFDKVPDEGQLSQAIAQTKSAATESRDAKREILLELAYVLENFLK